MLTPLRNEAGEVIPHDDPSIHENSGLIRHINPTQIVDENTAGQRISSGAFSASSGDPHFGMSVDLEQALTAAGRAPNAMVPAGLGAVRLRVAPVRALSLRVGSDPTPQNEFHGQVWGVQREFRARLHAIVESWVVPLCGVSLR